MSNIKMIAIDLDDTLLRTDLTISWHTRRIIKKVQATGVVVVIASGRGFKALERYVKQLKMDKKKGYVICGNGTTIHNTSTGNIIEQILIPQKIALAAFDLVDSEGFAVQMYRGDQILVSRKNEYTDIDHNLTGLKQTVKSNFRDIVKDGCDKLVIPADPMILKPLETILKNVLSDDATLFTSKPYFLEVLPPATNKGSALENVSKKLGISRESVMAFGDSMNDEAMIQWAGHSVAMINGDERIKKIAHAVTEKTNDEDGVAHHIKKFVLNDNVG
ncbi:MAG: Cof-type HAD-IIB family hydrolase [Spirochaetaceae bacterium]|jgi:Cof subfamily protein (haloacid dehalogenase superfamily)|nr:Cof-type HAD-IIB family hydrolase [Spirochaetaceae bacterium]